MLTPAEADRLIGQHLQCLPIESLPLAQCAGSVLRENVYAERDQPPFDRVTADGVALDSQAVSAGTRAFRIQGSQAEGAPPLALAGPHACIRVTSGAVLPDGCDSVVPVAELALGPHEAALGAGARAEPGRCVQRRGSEERQGALLLSAGRRLHAPDIAIAAAAGMARIRVSSQPMLAVISVGRELIEPGEPVLDHQLRRANAYAIVSALREHGFQRVADDHLQDEASELRARLRFHLETHDVLVISGASAAARCELILRVLTELGVRGIVERIAQRPGEPLWFGVASSGAAVFVLPGSPVASLVCLTRYVLPALHGSLGRSPSPPERMALGASVTVESPLTVFQPVRFEPDDWGRTWAQPAPCGNGIAEAGALAGTDGFLELPPGPQTYAKGFVTRLYRWA